ncbi:hypothetical protein M514_07644 [Trichuris suis]|uniref:Uncharacterized protein n=1 Tax=Trichuris suis TaxID=68888 RepID=A0A085M2I5_9BILA|nr:hypothetical protein M513_07644 [Trichuris suis]KFD65757.1 hypothetical protein M514_07644 [Trichuris suis]
MRPSLAVDASNPDRTRCMSTDTLSSTECDAVDLPLPLVRCSCLNGAVSFKRDWIVPPSLKTISRQPNFSSANVWNSIQRPHGYPRYCISLPRQVTHWTVVGNE